MNREVVAKVNELSDGELKNITVGEKEILLLRVGDEYRAYAPKCPHHGAPLADGAIIDGKLRCPWHQAVYDALTGKRVEPPSLDDLPRFETEIVGENVVALLPREIPSRQTPRMTVPDLEADARQAVEQREGQYHAVEQFPDERLGQGRTFVIVGSGAAGLAAAECLREEGFAGNVTVLTADEDLPYDRTDLSKRYLQKPDASAPMLRDEDFFERFGIQIITDCSVSGVDLDRNILQCNGGEELAFDKLLLATGSEPRRLGVDGEDLDNVFTLRNLRDCNAIRNRADNASKAVVIGASFIGMEVAASLTQREIDVTVVDVADVPFGAVFGEKIGRMYQNVHEDKGVAFHLATGVEGLEGQDGAVTGVKLADGRTLPADMVVVGVGVTPRTGFLTGLDLGLKDDGSIPVDATMRVRGQENLFAAGDIASFPDWRTGEDIRIEHWRLAQQLGRTAARAMLDKNEPYTGTPFFWTNQYMVISDYVGYASDWDEIRVDGSIEDQDFLAYYLSNGQVRAIAGCGRDRPICVATDSLQATELLGYETMRQAIRSGRSVRV
jgi:NADPH-dependent 2,4-dienoyl-CoA reductase/sulfur reductase-like enzyme/nitrite reductase/ring-hydroxylating ferredoxin subunit